MQDAVGLAGQIRVGDLSAREAVDAAIARIGGLNDELNAVIHPTFGKARAAADTVLPAASFRGVPFLVKDAVCETRGDPYHMGMRALKDAGWRAERDSYLAGRFRDAGFVIVGRTNTSELATATTTEPLAYGPTPNPWDTEYSAGGSSGGSAAAVASGMVPVAHGNDMGGSIRIPASECGVVGLKPSRGRTSLGPVHGGHWAGVTSEGVLSRTVRDVAAVMDAVAGPAPGDPYVAPPFARSLLAELTADEGPLRIGYRSRVPRTTREPHLECVEALDKTVEALRLMGHEVEDAAPDALDDETGDAAYLQVMAGCIAHDLQRWSDLVGTTIDVDQLEPITALLVGNGRAQSVTDYLAAHYRMQQHARALAGWWDEGFDLLVTPTLAQLPPRLGVIGPSADVDSAFPVMVDVAAFVTPWNVSGQPAISLPVHWSAEGLPVGVQLVAPYGREDLLIRVAAQLEDALSWANRHPPLWAG